MNTFIFVQFIKVQFLLIFFSLPRDLLKNLKLRKIFLAQELQERKKEKKQGLKVAVTDGGALNVAVSISFFFFCWLLLLHTFVKLEILLQNYLFESKADKI